MPAWVLEMAGDLAWDDKDILMLVGRAQLAGVDAGVLAGMLRRFYSGGRRPAIQVGEWTRWLDEYPAAIRLLDGPAVWAIVRKMFKECARCGVIVGESQDSTNYMHPGPRTLR
eukprot:TRINITY_DN4437_c0_g1_i1.p3 TRINITY_DN4437_c0_g1~~TRINITY_DN4437_c0_g1_i1.p3  ORF type:complete len:113 (+),score=35.70 TRINITY_DN4437_c0_g1_i1:454-792(+)